MSLNSEIKTIIQGLTPTTLYLRAATLNEANVELPQIELVSPIGIHADLPTITNTQTENAVHRSTPVQVMFLQKNNSQDDSGEEVDTILDSTKILADQFYDALSRSGLLDPTTIIEGYDLDAVPAYQFSDEILSGWILSLDFPEVRRTYYCP
jgi:hypothetical protein